MRRILYGPHLEPVSLLPPAIRPGLHCGRLRARVMLCFSNLLPPAIRPGLHCGDGGRVQPATHGAGFPRPSGRGSIAASWAAARTRSSRRFPRPSGRGSIAAPSVRSITWPRQFFPRPSGRGSIAAPTAPRRSTGHAATSPGHQAGAPLRRVAARQLGRRHDARLPPAIRPGLHCGT